VTDNLRQLEDLASAPLVIVSEWAAELVRGRRVLNASSALQATTVPLLHDAREVAAVAPRAAVVEALPDLVGTEVKGHHAELTRLPFASDSFQAVMSLDLDPCSYPLEEVLEEFARVLDPGDGLLIIALSGNTRPTGQNQVDEDDPAIQALYRALRERLPYVMPVHYDSKLVSTFSPIGDAEGSRSFAAEKTPGDGATHKSAGVVVVASHRSIEPQRTCREMTFELSLPQWLSQVDRLSTIAREQTARTQRAEASADDRAMLLRELFRAEQALAREFDRRVRKDDSPYLPMEGQTQGLHEQLHIVQQQLADARNHIAALQSTVSWRITGPLRAVRRRTL
jgi:SAM-dependent methyltransferase